MCCPSPIFKPGNLRRVKFDSMLSRLSPTKGVKGHTRGSQCTSNSPFPHPLSPRKLKKALKLPSHRHLPTHTTLHFLPPPYIFAPTSPPPYSVPPPSFCQLKENKSDPRNNDPPFNQPKFKCNTFCYVEILVSKRFLLLFPRSERERERLSRRETPEKWLGDELLSFKTLRFLFSRK